MNVDEIFYHEMYRIRKFEETVLDNFSKGIFHGTTHTYLGQEANAVGVLSHLRDEDIIFSNHRCHGHFLAYGGDMRALFAELMGRRTGICGGRGGSQHLHWRNFYSNGVQGGIVPIATGMALAEKRQNSEGATICFLGDGTLGQGVLYEALNMASLWDAPILYVLENNKIAQTTPIDMALAGSILNRFKAFGISTYELDTSDVKEIAETAGYLLEDIHATGLPKVLILHTHRFGPHSKGDDTRDPALISALKVNRDPMIIQAARLEKRVQRRIKAEVDQEVRTAFEYAMHEPKAEGNLDQINTAYGKITDPINPKNGDINPELKGEGSGPMEMTVLNSINQALHQAMEDDERVVILGEDILDPYGGAFKATRGLSSAFPDRVITTPISEAGIVGLSAGMALRGLRPVVEIMFGDFITLAVDQIVNHIAKFRWMFDESVKVPLVIRTPMGGRRGYGPTHSQTLEKLFLGVPGLQVLAVCDLGSPGDLLLNAIRADEPILFIENKLLYQQQARMEGPGPDWEVNVGQTNLGNPWYWLRIKGAPTPNLTIATYGYIGILARQALLTLAFQNEIFVDLIIMTQLSPFELSPVIESTQDTGRLLTIEEGTRSLGWGAEVVAQASDVLGDGLKMTDRLAAPDQPVPAARGLENAVLPGIEHILRITKSIVVKG